MEKNEKLFTEFASAEKAEPEEIKRQYDRLSVLPLLNKFFDSVPDFMLVLNKERQIVFANRSFIDFLGVGKIDALLGLRPGEALGCMHAHETAGSCGTTEFCRTCGAVKAILSCQMGKADVQECRVTREGNGESLDLRVWASPLQVESEQFTIFAVVDISNEKRRRALERIFFHDVMNTIGGLSGFAELLESAKPADAVEFSRSISRLTDRLVGEINAQRELAAAENNELSLHPVSLDSVSLLEGIADLYKNHEVARDRKVVVDPNSQRVNLLSDKTLLSRIIGNMVKNALEAAEPGETITIGCFAKEKGVEFTVHNPGFMPREIQLQVFQRSFSTKGNGRGLGTYSMKLLGERYLKGGVSFTTSEQTGTTFKISLSNGGAS